MTNLDQTLTKLLTNQAPAYDNTCIPFVLAYTPATADNPGFRLVVSRRDRRRPKPAENSRVQRALRQALHDAGRLVARLEVTTGGVLKSRPVTVFEWMEWQQATLPLLGLEPERKVNYE